MRKCMLLVSVLMLALAGCGEGAVSATIPPAPPVSQTPAPESVVSGGVVLPRGLLPQSEYEPPKPPERRYSDVTLKLIPSDDYGRIWPYLGAYTFETFRGDIYGLCDNQGRIICDPFYNQVVVIERAGHELIMLTKNREDEEGRRDSVITLATPDGSWAGEYEDVLYDWNGLEVAAGGVRDWCGPVVFEYVTVCQNGKWGVVDYEGHEVLPCVYSAPVCFSEGLAAVLSYDEKTYSFIDKTGSVIHGPYETRPRQQHPYGAMDRDPLPLTHGLLYSEGLARFYVDGKYGVIDHSGEVVIQAQYDFITPYAGGTAEFSSGGKHGIIGIDGTVLLELTNNSFRRQRDGTILLHEAGEALAFDPLTGERKPWVESDALDRTTGSNGITIEWDGGKLYFPGATDVLILDNGNFALTFRGEKRTWNITNRDGETLAGPFDGYAYSTKDGLIYVECYYSVAGIQDYGKTLYDETGSRVLPEIYDQISLFSGRYLVRQGAFGGLLDENGDWVIKAPLYDSID